MNDTIEATVVFPVSVRSLLSMLPCFLFLYVNVVMLFALLSRPLLLESPRYILFGHLLLADSLQLIVTMLLFIFALTAVTMISYACVFVLLLSRLTLKLSPLNLAVMSLERYVAICFPLRHAEIVTTRKTGVAIAVMWTVGSLDSLIQLFLYVSLENTNLPMSKYCHIRILQLEAYSTVTMVFTFMYFTLVCIIIIYTYIAVMITVKSASTAASSASKAHKTVLLHLIQFCLYLISILFDTINSSMKTSAAMASIIQYILFIGLLIFPKCLSPLLYGLRDQTFKKVFKYYFTFGFTSTDKIFPKP